ncbi:ABC transporter permease [Breoghania sp.]|uniref:cell division protein FtsX n=1 Tax=Breoghania sp. TaxID=2065378 RepID=UPI002605D2D5|nr:ABC transporter permease [Breoghania sp.]MDJ0930449.1 ABC transporter permease [Breoghania sp.]
MSKAPTRQPPNGPAAKRAGDRSAREPIAERDAGKRPANGDDGKGGSGSRGPKQKTKRSKLRKPPLKRRQARGSQHTIRPPAAIVPQQSVAGRALTLVVAIMAFLACLTVGGVTLVSDAAHDWQNDLVREVTIQIKPIDGMDMVREIDKAIALAQKFSGIGEVRALSDEETRSLLQPWLGSDLDLKSLPVPRLIAVKLTNPETVDFHGLRDAISSNIKGGSLDDHSVWTQRLSSMAGAVVTGGLLILMLMLIAMMLSVVFATRAAMAGNREVVEVLHLVGAENSFIAREFERHFLWLGLRGGIAGGGAAAVSFVIFNLMNSRDTGFAGADQVAALIGGAGIGLTGYLGVAGVVVLVALLTALTSRIAVHNHLTHMD